MTSTEDINRLHTTLERLFDKIDAKDDKINRNDVLLEKHLTESKIRVNHYDKDIEEIKLKIEALETFMDENKGSDKGKNWLRNLIHSILTIILGLWLLFEKFGGLFASRHN